MGRYLNNFFSFDEKLVVYYLPTLFPIPYYIFHVDLLTVELIYLFHIWRQTLPSKKQPMVLKVYVNSFKNTISIIRTKQGSSSYKKMMLMMTRRWKWTAKLWEMLLVISLLDQLKPATPNSDELLHSSTEVRNQRFMDSKNKFSWTSQLPDPNFLVWQGRSTLCSVLPMCLWITGFRQEKWQLI